MKILNCQTLQNVEVGDVVYMRPTGNARYWHPRQPYVKGVVTKIGRKYFTVDRGLDGVRNTCVEKFTLDGARCVNNDNYGYILYASQGDFERDTERDQKFSEIRSYCGKSVRNKELSYEAICRIHEIMRQEGVL